MYTKKVPLTPFLILVYLTYKTKTNINYTQYNEQMSYNTKTASLRPFLAHSSTNVKKTRKIYKRRVTVSFPFQTEASTYLNARSLKNQSTEGRMEALQVERSN